MRRLAPLAAARVAPTRPITARAVTALLAASLLLGGCRPCLQPGVDDCAALRAMNPAALRATAWLLDEEAFGRRDAPTPGAVRAAHVVAAQLQALGLQPGGESGTFLQEVPLTVDEPRKPALVVIQGNVEVTLADERDFHLLEAHGDTQVKVDAEVVLADGVTAEQAGRMRGRVALVPVHRPAEADLAAAAVTRLRAQGAAGVLLCTRGPAGRDAYHKLRERLQRPAVRLAQAPRTAGQGAARLVFALAPPACAQLLATAAMARRATAANPVLPLRVRGQARLEPKPARGWNAVGVYRAARDPAAAPVVVTASLLGPGVDVAALLEIGRALVQLRARPPRPVILAALAAAPGAPVGMAHFERSGGGRGPGHLHVLPRGGPADRAAVEAARLVEALLRGAAHAPAP
ncbi:MAG: hypothetical protein HY906_05105 [Deltaproteobacteria bacterium]|nr:hypothetical protein [Deltaproteobacteria bacterium]